MIFARTAAAAGLSVVAASIIGACSSAPGVADLGPARAEAGAVASGETMATGSIGMALTIAPGVQFESLGWTITGPSGPFSGNVPIDSAQSIEFVTGGIAAGGPYTVSLSGTDSAGGACSGSGMFDVTAGAVTGVSVVITCEIPTDAAIAADVHRADGAGPSAPAFNCPVISSFAISPSTLSVGQSSQLNASTTVAPGGSPGTPTFQWTVSPPMLGGFSDATSDAPVFQCLHPGSIQVTVTAGLTGALDGVDAGNVCSGSANSSATGTIECQSPVAVAVALGADHTCALLASGQVYCWGLNEDGQLGDGTTTDSSTPVAVSGLSGSAAAIAAGGLHTCALLTNGTVECWGQNASGQLGNGTNTSSPTPVAVSSLTGVTAIASGELFTCALIAGGTVQCWGDDDYGELGNSLDLGAFSPIPLAASVTGATAIVAGYSHACALLSGGAVSCWGDNTFAELGGGTSLTSTPTPVAVLDPSGASSLQGAVAIAAGIGYHTCALLSGGALDCWGSNSGGQLGNATTGTCDGSTPCSSAPVTVAARTGVQAIAAAWRDSYALLTGGAVDAWGDNLDGELGQGTATGSSQTPVAVKGLGGTGSLGNVASLYAGADHACALLPSGAIECWGDDVYGELGNGETGSSALVPVAVTW